MKLGEVKKGDLVKCRVRGDMFYAVAESSSHEDKTRRKTGINIASLTGRPIPTLFVTAQQVVAHYRKSKQSIE